MKQERKTKECNFITLHDTSMFKDLKMPSAPTNYVLWYKKEDPNVWGLTIKKFDAGEEFSSQYVWKISWVFDPKNNNLRPSLASAEFTESITGEIVDKLIQVKSKYLNKKPKSPKENKK
jgi:hypothetical protein